MSSMKPSLDETKDLRRCVRDLVALSTLPVVWDNADPLSIGRSLAEVLRRILSVEFIYVRLEGRGGGSSLEAARTHGRAEPAERTHEIGQALAPWLRFDAADAPPTIPNPVGEGTVRLVVLPIGHEHDYGILAAGGARSDFPTDTERLLLGVAVNQVAGLLQRKEVEETLRRQSEWLRITLASIGDAVITTDTQGRVTSLNAVAESFTGWPQGEAQGQPLEVVFHIVNEHSRQGVESPATRALCEGRIVGLANHTVLIARDGSERAIDDSAAPIRDDRGNVIGVVLIFRDVSERRQAERAVAASEARNAAILQTALDCIITCDQQGRVLEFNPAAQRTFGYTPDEVIGRDMADLIVPPALRERHRHGMARYVATGEDRILNRRVEMTARRADGTEFPVELAITRIPTPGPPQFTAYLRDISERKSLERRRSARLAVTQVLAQAVTLKEAAPRILQAVCESLGWDMGAFWAVDRQANALRCQELWHTAPVRAEEFTECCRQRTFGPGIGLPGRVWSSRRAAWIPDVAKDANFPRAPIAVAEGLHGAFGAPVLSGSELLGVIEFFSREIREPDSDLLEMMATIGSQIGQFIDRKRAEEALRWLAAIVESSDDVIISKNLDGIILSWNQAAERLYGYTAAEIVGKPLSILVPPNHPDELPAIMERLRRGERISHYETVRVCKGGRRVDVSLTISPVRGADGTIIGASKIARDITARKQAEEKLRESEERLRSIFSQTLAGIAQTDLTGRFVQVNERYCRIVGRPAEELYGLRMQDITHPDDLSRNLALFLPLVRGDGQPFVIEKRYVRPDGSEVWVMNNVSLLRDRDGRPKYGVAVSLDITDRKRDEQTTRFLADASATLAELTDYESTLQRIAGLAVPHFADWCAVDMQQPDGSVRRLAVTHTDPAKVQLADEFFRRYPPLPTDRHGVIAVLRSGAPDWATSIPDSLLVEAAQDEDHLRMMRELGLKSYICVPLKSRTKTLGVLTFVMAESGRVYDADDLRAAEDLAARAAIAIENASLVAALKETDRRKDEFLAILAHELRNPLAPIRNAVQIFRGKGPPVPELQWARDVIDRQVQQMTRLVDDLLDVSRITRGKIQLRKERVPLAAVVTSAVEASRPLIEKWDHELTVTLPPESIDLEADPTRLAQVLLNLLNNAAKYTEQGGRIWLTVEREGGQVAIRVKDTGIGIPPEMLPRIFEMFTQVDRSLERSQGGLGIGLTLVQRLVEMHGGTIEAHSGGPGEGSEFIVRLPVAIEVKDRGARGTTGEKMAAPAKCRILVVDDNQDAADSLAMLLRMLGNEVHTAHDGLEAVGAAAVFRPDVVLLDIGLPKLNGYEAARRIREQQGKDVVLVALTGWGQEEDRRRSREAGFDHHMTKPVEFDVLQKLLAGLKTAPS